MLAKKDDSIDMHVWCMPELSFKWNHSSEWLNFRLKVKSFSKPDKKLFCRKSNNIFSVFVTVGLQSVCTQFAKVFISFELLTLPHITNTNVKTFYAVDHHNVAYYCEVEGKKQLHGFFSLKIISGVYLHSTTFCHLKKKNKSIFIHSKSIQNKSQPALHF